MNKNLERFLELRRKIMRFRHMLSVISFDSETICPEMGREEDSLDIIELSGEIFSIQKSDEYVRLVTELHENKDFDEYTNRLIDLEYRSIKKREKIDAAFQREMDELFQDAYVVWIKAREKKDFSIFAPTLAKIRDLDRKLALLYPDTKKNDLYSAIFDDYEEGFTSNELDVFFDELQKGIVPLLEKVRKSSYVPRHDILNRKVPIHKQEEFGRFLLKFNGFDFKRGDLSVSVHPFTSQIAASDVRVTTNYKEDCIFSNMYSVIHEGGHALFGQNIPEQCFGSTLGEGALTMAKHESVSRFYENIIGRSRSYIKAIYPEFRRIFKDEMSDVSEDDLYEAVNYVDTSNTIRTEADELTYTLHIIIRYQLEKMMIDENIDISKASSIWNKLYKDLLKVEVKDDKEGILQDIHWTTGFGYFPTYALGNALGAIYYDKMKKDIDVDALVEKGRMDEILSYLRENVFKRASLVPTKKWIEECTGEKFSASFYVKYLEEKFTSIYHL